MSSSPPLAFTLGIFLERDGSSLSLCLVPSSHLLLQALQTPNQSLSLWLPSPQMEFLFLEPEE